MGREVETKESTLDRFAKITQIGSQIAGTLQNVQRIGQAQQGLNQDQQRIKLAQDHAKMQQEEWGYQKERLAEQYKQQRLETRTKAGDQLNNEIFNVLDNSAASADPKAYVDSWVSNPDNINRLAKVAQIGELPFQESDVNLLKKNMLVAAPFLKSSKSAEAKLQQALTAPDAAFDAEAAQKALAEYNAAFNGTSGILPRAMSKTMQDRQDAYTKEIDAKNKRIEDSRQKGLDRASREREATAKANEAEANRNLRAEPPSTIKTKLSGYIQSANNLSKMMGVSLGEVRTGPDTAIKNYLGQVSGMNNPDRAALNARIINQLETSINNLTGAAAPKEQMDRIEASLPRMKDTPEVFAKMAATAIQIAEETRLGLESQYPGYDSFKRYQERIGQMPSTAPAGPGSKTLPPPPPANADDFLKNLKPRKP